MNIKQKKKLWKKQKLRNKAIKLSQLAALNRRTIKPGLPFPISPSSGMRLEPGNNGLIMFDSGTQMQTGTTSLKK